MPEPKAAAPEKATEKSSEASVTTTSKPAAEEIMASALAKAQAHEEGHPRAFAATAKMPPVAARVAGLGMDNVALGVRMLTDFLVNRFGDDLEELAKNPAFVDFWSTWISDEALRLADRLLHGLMTPSVMRGDVR